MAETEETIRKALAEPAKKKAGKKRAARKKPDPPKLLAISITEMFEDGVNALEKIIELKADSERFEFMLERWLSVAKKGHSDYPQYFVTRGTQNVGGKDFSDPREAMDDLMRREKR